ncbi:hypothetical protein YC2023_100811 [Brassica napus]
MVLCFSVPRWLRSLKQYREVEALWFWLGTVNWKFRYVEFGFVVLVTASFTLSCACVGFGKRALELVTEASLSVKELLACTVALSPMPSKACQAAASEKEFQRIVDDNSKNSATPPPPNTIE